MNRVTCWDDPDQCMRHGGCTYCNGGHNPEDGLPTTAGLTPIQAHNVDRGLPAGEPWPEQEPRRQP